ncbi:MAG TPA: hypothetical protein VFM12_06255 [Gemmatimonadales bacterium]|jgi:hypothetical protein|nr:hypothetical protein [Gemmatimonadales bacterium]
MRIFINEKPFDLPPGATVRDAVEALDPDLLPDLGNRAQATDGRGIALAPEDTLSAGSILRVLRSARQAGDADA